MAGCVGDCAAAADGSAVDFACVIDVAGEHAPSGRWRVRQRHCSALARTSQQVRCWDVCAADVTPLVSPPLLHWTIQCSGASVLAQRDAQQRTPLDWAGVVVCASRLMRVLVRAMAVDAVTFLRLAGFAYRIDKVS
jgi:hypothetical protein